MKAWDVCLFVTASNDPHESGAVLKDIEKEYPGAQYSQIGGWLHERDARVDYILIDTVFFDDDCDRDYVKRSLINHDDYPTNIKVFQA
jgi:hypothetical protein